MLGRPQGLWLNKVFQDDAKRSLYVNDNFPVFGASLLAGSERAIKMDEYDRSTFPILFMLRFVNIVSYLRFMLRFVNIEYC